MKRLIAKFKRFIKTDDGKYGLIGMFIICVLICGTLAFFEMGYISYVFGFFTWLFYMLNYFLFGYWE